MFYRGVGIGILASGLITHSLVAAPIVETFEGSSQGALSNGTAINDLTVGVAGTGSAGISSSPFVGGGSNAFQFNGESGGAVTLSSVPTVGGVGVEIDFSLTLSRAATTGNGSRFLSVTAAMPDDSIVEIIRLHYKMNAGATQTWLVASNGAGTFTDFTFLPLNANARVDVTTDLVAGTYGVSITLDNNTVLTNYSGLTLMTAGTASVRGFTLGDITGSNIDGKADNFNVVPEPASAALALLATGLMCRSRRR